MTPISEASMLRVSRFLADNLGWHFPPDRWRDLERGLTEITRARGFETVEACIDWLLSPSATGERIEAFAHQFTVGETYFNREIKSLEVLEQHVLPELVRSRRGGHQRLRIWSAGCCTGEEPYSIAMLLDRMIPDPDAWNITILGTDINPSFLAKARAGIYSEWSFRGAPNWLRNTYFSQHANGRFEILPRIKRMVQLAQLNLAEAVLAQPGTQASAMDVILCRNVLIYFSPERAAKVLSRLYDSLSINGWLVVGQTETALAGGLPFATVNFPGAVLFRRLDGNQQNPPQIVEGTPPWFEPVSTVSVQSEPQWQYEASTIEVLPATESEITWRPDAELERSQPTRNLPLTRAEELSLYHQGRYEELTFALLERTSNGHSLGDPLAMSLLAKVFANQGRYDEAFEWIERAIDADKLDAGMRYLHATILQERNRVDDAILSLNRAIYLEPRFVIAHFSLGNLLLKQGRLQEAKRSMATALALLPDCPKDEPLPESDGISAGRLSEIITSITSLDAVA